MKKTISIIQLYTPCKSKKELTTTYQQQYEQLQQQKRTDKPNVINKYCKDLSSLLYTLQNTSIIVMGNFNAAPDNKRLLNLQSNSGLQDVYKHYHQGQESNMQETGTKRIDNMLISTDLLHLVKNVGYEPFHQGIQSDHRGMYVDLHQNIFAPAPYCTQRILNAKHGTQVQKYREKLLKYIKEAHIIQRIKELQIKHKTRQW